MLVALSPAAGARSADKQSDRALANSFVLRASDVPSTSKAIPQANPKKSAAALLTRTRGNAE